LSVGVDVGGTWIRVTVLASGRPVARARARVTDVPEVGTFLRAVWRRRGWRRADVGAVVLASRGIWTSAERRALAARVRSLARRVVVYSDAQVALLGALGERPGMLILSGTGSIVIGRDGRERWARAGGFGPLLGDEGSAFWLGREWLRVTTQGEDFFPARRLVRDPHPIARIAALAPAIVARARRGDRRARVIVREGQRHLAVFALTVARRLRLRPPVAASWSGSVAADPWFRAGLARAVKRAGLRVRWHPPIADPVTAAAHLAERLTQPRPSLSAHLRREPGSPSPLQTMPRPSHPRSKPASLR
jgi:N-acetylglucosamine kinase-like BadF-type ATPase